MLSLVHLVGRNFDLSRVDVSVTDNQGIPVALRILDAHPFFSSVKVLPILTIQCDGPDRLPLRVTEADQQ